MAQTYEFFFVRRGLEDVTRSDPHGIDAEDTLDAIRRAEAFWRAQRFAERPLGFDLFDATGQPVHQFRSGRTTDDPDTAE